MSSLQSILCAARPKTLPAAIVPVWSGCVLAWQLTGGLNWLLAICTLAAAIAIQIATNFFNDVLDSDKGADTQERIGPIRVTASGLISRKSVYAIATLFLIIAALLSLPLIQARGWIIIGIGIPSLLLAYGYTGGPFPLAYLGLGEVFVILFFGLIAVTGTVFIQTGYFSHEAFLLGLVVGSFSSILITINNLRDVVEDTLSDKKTLAVRWGYHKARWLLIVEIALAGLSLLILAQPSSSTLCFLPLFICYGLIIKAIYTHPPSASYNKYLAQSGALLIAFAIIWHSLLAFLSS